MPLTRLEIEAREERNLAPYAARSAESRGRVYPQEKHPLRTDFQRDRDRIIHCAAFRRLDYKTQVFIPHEGDHFRTRLTHTIEVAQIARTLARCLQLNEDLSEAIALCHDLGHTPFGHSGEDVLDELLRPLGGFNHNRQSLRIVDMLENRYPSHLGLNLTYEVREGIVKHETTVKLHPPGFDLSEQPTLEAALVDIADEIAYNSHDIDDGLASGFIDMDALQAAPFWEGLGLENVPEWPDGQYRYALIRKLVDRMTTDVIEETSRAVNEFDIRTLADVRKCARSIAGYSSGMQAQVSSVKSFLKEHLYQHPNLQERTREAETILRTLWEKLNKDTLSLPDKFRMRVGDEPSEVVIADYIAGMTDRYAREMFRRLS